MRFRALASLLFVSVVTTAAACSSVPDVTFSDDAGSASSSGGTDAGADVIVVDPNCKKTGPEVCDDGIDNDCNGLADCADPACTAGYACVDPAPSGWTLMAFSAGSRPACPTGYTNSTDLQSVAGDGSGASCKCSCTGSGGTVATCDTGTTSVKTGPTNACGNASATANLNAGVTCTAFGTALNVSNGDFGSATVPNGPMTCSASTQVVKNALQDSRSCAPPAAGKGCPGSQVCIPKPTGMNLCAVKPGLNACPAPFGTQRRAGTAATDTRDCSGCTCQAAVPCGGSITIFSSANCTGGHSDTIALGAGCGALPDSTGFGAGAQAYKTTTSGGCPGVATQPTLTGALQFTGDETVCCRQ